MQFNKNEFAMKQSSNNYKDIDNNWIIALMI